jgi:hypothetical protein
MTGQSSEAFFFMRIGLSHAAAARLHLEQSGVYKKTIISEMLDPPRAGAPPDPRPEPL